jgi:hypothetical protein
MILHFPCLTRPPATTPNQLHLSDYPNVTYANLAEFRISQHERMVESGKVTGGSFT